MRDREVRLDLVIQLRVYLGRPCCRYTRQHLHSSPTYRSCVVHTRRAHVHRWMLSELDAALRLHLIARQRLSPIMTSPLTLALLCEAASTALKTSSTSAHPTQTRSDALLSCEPRPCSPLASSPPSPCTCKPPLTGSLSSSRAMPSSHAML